MNIDNFKIIPAFAVSPLLVADKFVHSPLISSRDTIMRSYQEGLIHFTSNEAVDSIIKSKKMHPSNMFSSYGAKKCFFFAGIPDIGTMCINIEIAKTMTALRVKLPYEELVKFNLRDSDGAVSYKGNLDLSNAILEKVRFGLKEKEGNLYYSEITEEEYNNYKLDVSPTKQKIINNKLAYNIYANVQGLKKEWNNFTNKLRSFMRDESSGLNMNTRTYYASENSDLFEKSSVR